MKKLIFLLLSITSLYGMNGPRVPVTTASKQLQNKNFGKTHFIVGYPAERYQNHSHKNAQLSKKKANKPVYVDNNKNTQAFFTSRHDIRPVLLSLFQQAKKSILIAAFALTDSAITEQIKKAFADGIKVEIITDKANMQERYSKAKHLAREKIPVYCYDAHLNTNPHQRNSRYARMHHKFIIIDDSIVINGSTNLTKSGQKDNIEHIVIIRDLDTVNDFITEFEHLQTMCICKTHE